MKKLVICEKPSVAKIIANELNCKIKKSDDINYYENEQYIVSNCLGHLLCLANPEAYSDDYKQWKNLPIFPEEYQYVPIGQKNERQQKQLSFLVKMIKDKNIKSIINACDAGREGELIFRYVYNHSKTNKPIERLWISSLEKKAIIDGFRNLKRGEDYDTLYLSANARAKSDWLVGMNLTRFYTQIFKNELKEKEVFSVGRVQTLTLSMIVKRDYEIKNFVKSNYYLLECSVNNIKFTSNQYDDIAEVRKDMENLKYERFIEILDIEKKEKVTNAPLLFDLTSLQVACNKRFGLKASETEKSLQSLYLKKLVSYPRTDSKYLNEEMKESIYQRYKGKEKFNEKNFSRLFNDKKVTDHHAIIITDTGLNCNLNELDDNENKIFTLISERMEQAVMANYEEEITEIKGNIKNIDFIAKTRKVINLGFKEGFIEEEKDDEKEDILQENNFSFQKINYQFNDMKIAQKERKPKQAYTDASLLSAMENAGKYEQYMERKGIGTPATRGEIIENLIKKGYVEREKKKLISTKKGNRLIKIVDNFLKDENTTAEWEEKLNKIKTLEIDEETFLKYIRKQIEEIIG